MSILTFSQATQVANASRSTIYRYAQKGIISVVQLPNGKRGIDTTELERVFGPLKPLDTSQDVPKLLDESQNILNRDTPAKYIIEQLIYFSVLTFFAWSALNSVTELVTRQKFSQFLSTEINSLSSTVIQAIDSKSQQLSSDQRPRISKIRLLKDGQSMLRSLVLTGAGSLEDIHLMITFETKPDGPDFSRIKEELKKINMLPRNIVAEGLRSEYLLAIAVISCATVGALVAGLRRKQAFTIRTVSLGISAGIITFFAIRGGKSVILLEASGGIAIFNPYGSAFLGLISGLFTERAFALLSDFVDATAGRVRTAIGVETVKNKSK